jgi:hypothetical protein
VPMIRCSRSSNNYGKNMNMFWDPMNSKTKIEINERLRWSDGLPILISWLMKEEKCP